MSFARVVGGLAPKFQVAAIVLGLGGVLALGITRVGNRREEIRLGYDLGEVSTELLALEEEDRRLRLELSVLTAPDRIERLAAELGMVRPPPTALRILDDAPAPEPEQP